MSRWGWGGGYGGYGRGRGYGRGWGAGHGGPGIVQMPSVPPPRPGVMRIVIATEGNRGLDDVVAYRFARAPYMTVVDVEGGKVSDVKVYSNPAVTLAKGAGIRVAQWLVSIGCRVAVGPRRGPNAAMVMEQAGVRFEPALPGEPVAGVLRRLGIPL